MKRALLNTLLTTALLALLSLGNLNAQNYERMTEVEAETFGDYAIVNSSDYQTVKNVRRYWTQEVQRLRQMRQLEFLLTGGNETILKVTIPSRLLFAQNDSTMLQSADNILHPFVRFVAGKDALATLIVAGYTDNNGSEQYIKQMSGARSRQVHRWFARQGVGPADIRSYGFANRVPRTENASIAQREKNRRVSLYFVPNKKMIRAAKKGNL